MLENSWVAASLAASQEGLSSIELVELVHADMKQDRLYVPFRMALRHADDEQR
jgi:hypothetical protein